MKKALKNIACAALATWFVSVAVGYNIVKYCCNACAPAELTLCENQTHENDNCCGGFSHAENNCTNKQNAAEHCALVYFKADFPITEHSENLKIEPKVFDLSIAFIQNDFFIEIISKKYQTNLFKSPPNHCGRDILSKKSVLII
ncbi:MAG: hypothetical protein LBS50_11920 [Prevotellaceae bacterium]|nr:hypothetical protein [Prevotellaceae bacterium]